MDKLPRGIRNKNPGNIKLGTDWDGLAKEQTDPVFCIFDEAVMGIRALMRILLVYRFHHKKTTIDDIISVIILSKSSMVIVLPGSLPSIFLLPIILNLGIMSFL